MPRSNYDVDEAWQRYKDGETTKDGLSVRDQRDRDADLERAQWEYEQSCRQLGITPAPRK